MTSPQLSEEFKRKCREIQQRHTALTSEMKTNRVINNCRKSQYKYGFEQLSLLKLLALVKKEGHQTPHVSDFLALFPETGLKNVKVTRSHVFEALWIIIFVLRMDNIIKKDSERILYKSVERGDIELKLDKTNNNVGGYLKKTNVNVSREGGVADIYFEDTPDKEESLKTIEKGYACDNKCESGPSKETVGYLYSSKYFRDDKKHSISGYDIGAIYTESFEKLQERKTPFKIGILANNTEAVFLKQKRSPKYVAKLLDRDISYDIEKLNSIYKNLIVYLQNIDLESNDPFSQYKPPVSTLKPRLHQQLFIDFTKTHIDKGDKKFVWGAVPLSGKSFMIGGLIDKMKPKCALIILGAVSETHQQFADMFGEYRGSFPVEEYNIDVKSSKSKDKFAAIDTYKKNIIIVSQQQLWQKKEGPYPKLIDYLSKIPNDEKIVFFDEIHQGASSDAKAQEEIIKNYIVEPGKPLNFPFIMVTATFLKPMLKYEEIGNKKSFILQWTYEMMQNMKNVSSEDIQKIIIKDLESDRNEEVGKEKSKLFVKLLKEHQKRGQTLVQLQDQYLQEPALCIVAPSIGSKRETRSWEDDSGNIRKILNIKSPAKSKNLSEGKIDADVMDLLRYIREDVYLNPDGPLARDGFNVLTQQHTQLWFLPTSLAERQKGNEAIDDSEKKGEVEPMMRYLLQHLLHDDFYRENFCFVLMHSKNISGLSSEFKQLMPSDLKKVLSDPQRISIEESLKKSGEKICFSTLCLPPNKDGDKECLRKEECSVYNKAKSKQKSLVILTAGKLRLGISLPCVDIAIHMDPITSVDTIYQSMFRVLTPSLGKKKGYFVDILKNRLIQFIYQYENQLNFNNKNIKSEDRLNRTRNIVAALINNVNVIDSSEEYIEKLNPIFKDFGLENITSFREKSEKFKINQENAYTLINSVFTDKDITDFYGKFGLSRSKTFANKLKEILIDRRDSEMPRPGKAPSGKAGKQDKEQSDSKKDKIVSIKEQRQQVTVYFLNLIALFILFYHKSIADDCKEGEVKDGIEEIKSIHSISKDEYHESTIEHLCDDENDLLKCYLMMAIKENINKNDLLTLDEERQVKIVDFLLNTLNERLVIFKRMIEQIEKDNMPELINIYCNIKNSFLMVKKQYHPDNMSVEPCSPKFIENEKILKIIRERLTVRSTEKEQHGEVFTPPELICEMLDTLPASVWKNKDLKWLDPANGIGNFPVIVYYKLMEGLKNEIRDEKKRSKHIIEKMLFMVELNPVNVRVCKKIFKMMDSDAEPNIVKANFLTETSKWKRELGRDTFDIVMGNPPYNEGGIRSKVGTKEDITTLWVPFIELAVNSMITGGHLLFITPNTWTELVNPISHFMLGFQIEYIRSYNYSQALTLFGKQSGKIPLSYFLLKKEKSKNDTLIWDNHHNEFIKFNIYENKFIPNFNVSIFKKVLKRSKHNNLSKYFYGGQSKNSSYFREEYTSEYLYPLLNYSYNKFNLFYSKKCFRGHNDIPKLVLPNFSMGYPILDKEGIMDTKSENLYIVQNKSFKISDLRKIQKLFLTPLVFLLINSLKTKQNFMSKRIFHVLPDATKLDFDITDEKLLYKYFGFDKKDIEAIEDQVKNGEGNLTPSERKAILDFDIHKYMTASQIKATKESIVKNCQKVTQTLKKRQPDSKQAVKISKKSGGKTRKRKKVNKPFFIF